MGRFINRLPWLKVLSSVFLSTVLGTFLLGMSGCTDEYYVQPSSYGSSYSRPYNYYYYPSSRVYYNASSGHYYHPHKKSWKRTKKLPDWYYLDSNERVHLSIKSKHEPYRLHHKHAKRYPARHKMKKDKRRDREERRRNYERYKKYSRSYN